MVSNAGKCHLLTSTSEQVSAEKENETIKNLSQEKIFRNSDRQ